jgi:hypothetical protein
MKEKDNINDCFICRTDKIKRALIVFSISTLGLTIGREQFNSVAERFEADVVTGGMQSWPQ